MPQKVDAKKSELHVFAPDVHYPEVNKKALAALLDFLQHNKLKTFIFGGDQFSNNEISHWNKKRIIFKQPGLYKRNSDGFDRDVLTKVEERLEKTTNKIWIQGNHERFEQDLIDEQPELEGTIEHYKILNLVKRGWEIVELGKGYKLGKLLVIHGENLTGIGNQAGAFPAKKAVESYAKSVLFGHIHTQQTYTKVLPHDESQKWAGYASPCIALPNPGYARNKPNAVVNGFTIVETNGDLFNVYPVVITNGMFSFGGRVYGAK